MKAFFAILTVILLLSCSFTQEQKARKLIRKYISENVDDIKSYEKVSTSDIDSFFTSYHNQQEYLYFMNMADAELHESNAVKALAESVRPFASSNISAGRKLDKYASLMMEHSKAARAYLDSAMVFEKNYVPEYVGPSIIHKFRSKDRNGAITLKSMLFIFDNDITEIINVYHDIEIGDTAQ